VINLKACNHFRLYNGKAAETELKALVTQDVSLDDSDLIRHNLVVFRAGENALQVLPQLLDYIPEAKLNLVIYYLKNNETMEAYEIIKDLEPSIPQEYILKGVVNARYGHMGSHVVWMLDMLRIGTNFVLRVVAWVKPLAAASTSSERNSFSNSFVVCVWCVCVGGSHCCVF